MKALNHVQRTYPAVTLSLLRFVVGWIFLIEGSGKLFGWFGGAGIEMTSTFYDHMKIPFSPYHATFVATTEFIGGICFVTGFLTQ